MSDQYIVCGVAEVEKRVTKTFFGIESVCQFEGVWANRNGDNQLLDTLGPYSTFAAYPHTSILLI